VTIITVLSQKPHVIVVQCQSPHMRIYSAAPSGRGAKRLQNAEVHVVLMMLSPMKPRKKFDAIVVFHPVSCHPLQLSSTARMTIVITRM